MTAKMHLKSTCHKERRLGIHWLLILLGCLVVASNAIVTGAQERTPKTEPKRPDKTKTKSPRRNKRRANVGRGGSTVQLPTFGVAIDAAGLLSVEAVNDPTGRLIAQRVAAARNNLPNELRAPARLRKVSLTKLQKAVDERLRAGKEPSDTMLNLAGLKRIEYVFVYPDEKDIVIAGPAEGFCRDLSGRPVGIETGEPILQFEHMVVAMRAYAPGQRPIGFIGCTIDPTRESLELLREFQATIPRVVRQNQRSQVSQFVFTGMRRSLGQSPIRVFGISPKTSFGHIMVEADFRMKRIGIGLEPKPVKMTTFIDALRLPPKATLQRWWLVPNYKRIQIADDQLALRFAGEAVQLRTEDYQIQADGTLVGTGRAPSKASQTYATAFTRKYAEIAAVSPVFAQLRTLVDLSVMAAFLQQVRAYEQIGWQPDLFLDEAKISAENHPEPQRVAAAVNVVWKGNRMISPAGGVTIQPLKCFSKDNLIVDKDGFATLQSNKQQAAKADVQNWRRD